MSEQERVLRERYSVLDGLMHYAEENGTMHTLAYQQWRDEASDIDTALLRIEGDVSSTSNPASAAARSHERSSKYGDSNGTSPL
jgi:hypothetical protein